MLSTAMQGQAILGVPIAVTAAPCPSHSSLGSLLCRVPLSATATNPLLFDSARLSAAATAAAAAAASGDVPCDIPCGASV